MELSRDKDCSHRLPNRFASDFEAYNGRIQMIAADSETSGKNIFHAGPAGAQ